MNNSLSKIVVGTGLAAMLAFSVPQKPAEASTQSTINTVLGAAAVIGGIILYNNYQHKKQQANRVVGYTQNGGTVYGDGRIVMRNGQTVYPNSNGQYPWGQYAYYNPNANGYQYGNPNDRPRQNRENEQRYNDGNNGNHYGEYKHRKDKDDKHGHHGEHGEHGDDGGD